jgi:hypothetical protein
LASQSFEPRIAFTPESKLNETNPWNDATQYITGWTPETADVLFLAGKDWQVVPPALARDHARPVINLIQHTRHADPNDELFRFLDNRAIRICVSNEVAEAIKSTGNVNGPVFVIPNGIAQEDIPSRTSHEQHGIDVLICGLKAPDLARQIEKRLRSDENIAVASLLEWIPRSEYLQHLSRAKIAVTLPHPSEGFYLPALEAMAGGALVVCPDCIGNRDFCRDRVNCFRPQYDRDEIVGAIYRALSLSPEHVSDMRKTAMATVREHSLENERDSFLQILKRLDELWGQENTSGIGL